MYAVFNWLWDFSFFLFKQSFTHIKFLDVYKTYNNFIGKFSFHITLITAVWDMLYTSLYVRYLTFSRTLRHLSIFFMFSNILSVTNVVSSPKASIHEHTERFTTNQQPTLLHWICNILMLNPFQIQIISLYWTKPKEASDNVFSYIIKNTHSFMCIYKT